MGTETILLYENEPIYTPTHVKLNNPLMGTETMGMLAYHTVKRAMKG